MLGGGSWQLLQARPLDAQENVTAGLEMSIALAQRSVL